MSNDTFNSSDEEVELSDSAEFAYSLFDDYKSTDAFEVYDHMEKKFGFKHNLLGNTTLHRVALLNYLLEKKAENKDVLKCYEELKGNKGLVLDNFENFVKAPFNNDKLVWGFMESSDSEAEELLLSQYVFDDRKREESGRKNSG